MKIFKHLRDGSNNVHIFQLKGLGKAKYYLRGILQGIQVGDIISFNNTELEVTELISVSDSKSNTLSDILKKNALIELECVDLNYLRTNTYLPLNGFGN